MDALKIIFWFSMMLGPLVILHELGHLLAAKRFGVLCYEYAIGIGPAIFQWQSGETLYSLRLFPLGGMVVMLDHHDGDARPGEAGRAVSDKPIWQRAIISFAGPAINLLIPIPIFFAFFAFTNLDGVSPAVIGTVESGSAAEEAGIEPGDRIVRINGAKVHSFEHLQRRVQRAAGQTLSLEVLRDGETIQLTAVPTTIERRHDIFPGRVVESGRLGISLSLYGSVVDVTLGGIASQSGLRDFDAVYLVNGEPVKTWVELERILETEGTHSLTVLRPEKTTDSWADVRLRHAVTLSLPGGQPVEALGLRSAEQTVWSVVPGSPVDSAGIRPGDRILAVEGKHVGELATVWNQLAVNLDKATPLTVDREGEIFTTEVTTFKRMVIAELNTEREEIFVGFDSYRTWSFPDPEPMSTGRGIYEGFAKSVRVTAEATTVLVKGVAALVTGELPSSSLGGPIMIAHVASEAARSGLESFLTMMAMMSVNLGVLNLVPIPGLDGGRLAVYGLEAIKRGPLSARTRQIINFVGLASLILLMVFVFKNDIERYWRTIADWLNS